MKIKMVVEMSGSRNGQPWPKRGETVDLATGEAQHLVASGIAVEVHGSEAPVEKATAPAAETSKTPEAEKPKAPAAEKRGRARPRKQQ